MDEKDTPPDRPDERPSGGTRAEREARLAAALRENLHRRKAQARARAAEAPPQDDTAKEG
jgi:hypothetical protein